MRQYVLFSLGMWFGLVALGSCAPEPDRTDHQARAESTLSATREAILSNDTDSLTTGSPTLENNRYRDTCNPDAEVAEVQYDVRAVLDWTARSVAVEQTVAFTNLTGNVLDNLVLTVEPNQVPGQFELFSLAIGDRPAGHYKLNGIRLTMPLIEPLKPGCSTAINLDYRLSIPEIQTGYQAGRMGYWGYSERQVNLGMWMPLLAAYDTQMGWLVPGLNVVGERFVLRAADFDVRIKIDEGPSDLDVAGPGRVSHINRETWRFEIEGAREVALSLGPTFEKLATTTSSGVAVELYYFKALGAVSLDTPRHALTTAADALAVYEDLFGPYPYERLVVVQGDFPDGMEFSGLVFVGDAWFVAWQGVPNDWLTLIVAHEVAHQWWYASVGSDQGNYPYLDEALATYSELLYLEAAYPEFREWWWNFRVQAMAPQGFVDRPVYNYQDARAYINAAYLRGAMMLRDIRQTIGDAAFLSWLEAYAAARAGQLATPTDFWGLLGASGYAETHDIRRSYLTNADVFPLPSEIP